ncbi:MAG: hypothetical protein ACP5NX_02305 [Candidatus Bilamarchaeaceae archaeon]
MSSIEDLKIQANKFADEKTARWGALDYIKNSNFFYKVLVIGFNLAIGLMMFVLGWLGGSPAWILASFLVFGMLAVSFYFSGKQPLAYKLVVFVVLFFFYVVYYVLAIGSLNGLNVLGPLFINGLVIFKFQNAVREDIAYKRFIELKKQQT